MFDHSNREHSKSIPTASAISPDKTIQVTLNKLASFRVTT